MKFLVIREQLRRQQFKKIEAKYFALKGIVQNQALAPAIRWEASLLLGNLSKRSSPVRFKKRCFLTGRGRGYINFFNLSRFQALLLARNNQLPFVTKSSW